MSSGPFVDAPGTTNLKEATTMDRKTALAAAGALMLTVVGGMSALAVAFGGGSPAGGSTPAGATDSTVVVTEYVDEAGNPIDGPGSVTAPPQQTVIVPVQGQADEVVIVRSAGGSEPGASFGGSTTTSVAGGDDFSDDEYEDEDIEYEDDEDSEYEDEDDHDEDEHEGEDHGDDD